MLAVVLGMVGLARTGRGRSRAEGCTVQGLISLSVHANCVEMAICGNKSGVWNDDQQGRRIGNWGMVQRSDPVEGLEAGRLEEPVRTCREVTRDGVATV